METCLYKGNQICAYDITNANYALNYDLKKEWKIAGQVGELRCEECGEEVQLRVNDPRKRVPHFSHKLSDSKCPFSDVNLRESEEHKRGKLLLYNYFREKYPELHPMVNYRFANRRRADLYMEFENGDKLVVEYQRIELDIMEWQERQYEYEKMLLNVLWLLSGKEEKIKSKEKQIEVTFFQQVMLNELDKVAVYLDVDKAKLVFSKNMRYSDPYIPGNDFEELYTKSYNLSDVLIHPNGKIECDFIKEYEKANNEFVSRYTKKCLDDEIVRKWKREQVMKSNEALIRMRQQEPRKVEIESEETTHREVIRFCSGDIPYKNKIKYAINGDENAVDFIARHLREWGNSDDLKVINLISKYNYLKGNVRIREVYQKVMDKAGFDCSALEMTEKDVSQLECPFCKGKLIQRYGKFGPYVTCGNYPQCKFSFNI